jgi:hypothetical protein
MYLVLLLIGLLAAGAGLAALGFGIPINEFSLGNTLILAGTIALSAGLILIGLAVALRQLNKIAQALAARPVPRALRPSEPDAGTSRPGAVRGPYPARPSREEGGRELRPEPQFVPAGNGTPAEVEEADAPLSPQARSPAADLPRGPRRDPPWRPILPTEMSTEWPAKNEMFDSLWPVGARGTKPSEPGAAKSEASPGAAAPARTQRSGDQAAPGEEGRAVSILKSGVVDGMAYTLYADGSIEAQLPEGNVRFASIDELRDHLEKHS